jgi:hypothetical protein
MSVPSLSWQNGALLYINGIAKWRVFTGEPKQPGTLQGTLTKSSHATLPGAFALAAQTRQHALGLVGSSNVQFQCTPSVPGGAGPSRWIGSRLYGARLPRASVAKYAPKLTVLAAEQLLLLLFPPGPGGGCGGGGAAGQGQAGFPQCGQAAPPGQISGGVAAGSHITPGGPGAGAGGVGGAAEQSCSHACLCRPGWPVGAGTHWRLTQR